MAQNLTVTGAIKATGSINTDSSINATGDIYGAAAAFNGSVTVNVDNTSGSGIILSDDGDIVDMNDGYCAMRFSSGVKIYSAKSSGTAKITLGNTGAISMDGDLTGLSTKEITGFGKVRNSVWNDFADILHFDDVITPVPGLVYVLADGVLSTAFKRAQLECVGIVSDTYGISTGYKEDITTGTQVAFAVSGFVLAHVDRVYLSGTPLVCSALGYLTAANWFERIFKSERILATYFRPEKTSIWNGVQVNKRHWVKVK
jgi:hypothetical protein